MKAYFFKQLHFNTNKMIFVSIISNNIYMLIKGTNRQSKNINKSKKEI